MVDSKQMIFLEEKVDILIPIPLKSVLKIRFRS